jgi:electron transport complex protein RnfC
MRNLGGVHLEHHKHTKDAETMDFGLPREIRVPMSQSMGAVPNVLVKKGDLVKVGQKIGDTDAFMSAPIHSPVSGEVVEIFDYLNPNGRHTDAVRIVPDGLQTVDENIKPPEISDKQSLIYAAREAGLVGLGGAAFPTHVKMSFDPIKTPIDTLVINGAECEPYITADNRCFLEDSSDIIDGILLCQQFLGIPHCKICIEDNKPQAIELMRKKTTNINSIEVVVMPSLYPQGAEKVAVFKATGRVIMEGELPSNAGAIVMNVSTVAYLAKYQRTGMPLCEKRITLDGTALTKNTGNLLVKVGTPVSELLEFAGAKDVKTVLYGGPMMGVSLFDTGQPILKSTNAILAFSEDIAAPDPSSCIRCGSCSRACPLSLMPMKFETAYKVKDVEQLKKLKLPLCMNCGCCSYVCPAHRTLAEVNLLAKELLRK